ncbi:TetR family transcriptional regulator [Arthrobacter sulfonylureivorans]|uniref:TetR family transcriptional regulator n=1 Tax=Arthrobacter sulfonylureivorans TaxID=2486855 RepID=A0ABY3W6X1_9MICC|nr:TetR family transcriptional regulator [Arthrobacter sulfonylureivorans]UNK45221.1 TetR family transcriptional regulator [Arthrobacter sulfonylureivorans]
MLIAAVVLADEAGVESLSMRKLDQELGVVPMAIYKHVANKEELLDGMVDVIVGEIDTRPSGSGWRNEVRQRVLSAREVLLRHPWARQLLESRTNRPPVVLE